MSTYLSHLTLSEELGLIQPYAIQQGLEAFLDVYPPEEHEAPRPSHVALLIPDLEQTGEDRYEDVTRALSLAEDELCEGGQFFRTAFFVQAHELAALRTQAAAEIAALRHKLSRIERVKRFLAEQVARRVPEGFFEGVTQLDQALRAPLYDLQTGELLACLPDATLEVAFDRWGRRAEVLYRGEGTTDKRIVVARIFDREARACGEVWQGEEHVFDQSWHPAPPTSDSTAPSPPQGGNRAEP